MYCLPAKFGGNMSCGFCFASADIHLHTNTHIRTEQINALLLQNNVGMSNKKAQLSLTNPRDTCEKFARFT